jgi:hypothetical protein
MKFQLPNMSRRVSQREDRGRADISAQSLSQSRRDFHHNVDLVEEEEGFSQLPN